MKIIQPLGAMKRKAVKLKKKLTGAGKPPKREMPERNQPKFLRVKGKDAYKDLVVESIQKGAFAGKTAEEVIAYFNKLSQTKGKAHLATFAKGIKEDIDREVGKYNAKLVERKVPSEVSGPYISKEPAEGLLSPKEETEHFRSGLNIQTISSEPLKPPKGKGKWTPEGARRYQDELREYQRKKEQQGAGELSADAIQARVAQEQEISAEKMAQKPQTAAGETYPEKLQKSLWTTVDLSGDEMSVQDLAAGLRNLHNLNAPLNADGERYQSYAIGRFCGRYRTGRQSLAPEEGRLILQTLTRIGRDTLTASESEVFESLANDIYDRVIAGFGRESARVSELIGFHNDLRILNAARPDRLVSPSITANIEERVPEMFMKSLGVLKVDITKEPARHILIDEQEKMSVEQAKTGGTPEDTAVSGQQLKQRLYTRLVTEKLSALAPLEIDKLYADYTAFVSYRNSKIEAQTPEIDNAVQAFKQYMDTNQLLSLHNLAKQPYWKLEQYYLTHHDLLTPRELTTIKEGFESYRGSPNFNKDLYSEITEQLSAKPRITETYAGKFNKYDIAEALAKWGDTFSMEELSHLWQRLETQGKDTEADTSKAVLERYGKLFMEQYKSRKGDARSKEFVRNLSNVELNMVLTILDRYPDIIEDDSTRSVIQRLGQSEMQERGKDGRLEFRGRSASELERYYELMDKKMPLEGLLEILKTGKKSKKKTAAMTELAKQAAKLITQRLNTLTYPDTVQYVYVLLDIEDYMRDSNGADWLISPEDAKAIRNRIDALASKKEALSPKEAFNRDGVMRVLGYKIETEEAGEAGKKIEVVRPNMETFIQERGLTEDDTITLYANELTKAKLALVKEIDFDEFKQPPAFQPKIGGYIDFFNKTSGRVRRLVVSEPSLEGRVRIYEQTLKIMDRLLEAGDFDSAMSLFSGLQSTAVFNLKLTKASLSKEAKEIEKRAEELFSHEFSYKMLRTAYRTRINEKKPVIIYMGLLSTDCTFIREGNVDRLSAQDKLFAEQETLYGETIGKLPQGGELETSLASEIEGEDVSDKRETELFELSRKREPSSVGAMVQKAELESARAEVKRIEEKAELKEPIPKAESKEGEIELREEFKEKEDVESGGESEQEKEEGAGATAEEEGDAGDFAELDESSEGKAEEPKKNADKTRGVSEPQKMTGAKGAQRQKMLKLAQNGRIADAHKAAGKYFGREGYFEALKAIEGEYLKLSKSKRANPDLQSQMTGFLDELLHHYEYTNDVQAIADLFLHHPYDEFMLAGMLFPLHFEVWKEADAEKKMMRALLETLGEEEIEKHYPALHGNIVFSPFYEEAALEYRIEIFRHDLRTNIANAGHTLETYSKKRAKNDSVFYDRLVKEALRYLGSEESAGKRMEIAKALKGAYFSDKAFSAAVDAALEKGNME
ncbi:RasGEF domain-containing protein [Thermoproteota archaeon]